METFTEPKGLVANPRFHAQRKADLAGLTEGMIDAPIRPLITRINNRADCFTLQCCHGHFLLNDRDSPHTLDPLPYAEAQAIETIRNRLFTALAERLQAP